MYQLSMSTKDSLLAKSRTRYAWNERFEHWERPASRSEEDQIERAARMVRAGLAGRDLLEAPFVTVTGQGSYFNNTNYRLDSDMDIRADWQQSCVVVTDGGISSTDAMAGLGLIPLHQDAAEIHAAHRRRVWLALCAAFGADQVEPGQKSLKLKAVPGSRAPADVVPTIRCVYAVPTGTGGLLSFIPREVEGVAIYEPGGQRTVNFPARHHLYGKEKHARTRRRFKKAVRILKWLRDELVDFGHLQKGQVPSFLIECLVHTTDDNVFLVDEDRYDRVRRLLVSLDDQLRNPLLAYSLTEINGIKPLFGNFLGRPQPWSVSDARVFLSAAWARLEV